MLAQKSRKTTPSKSQQYFMDSFSYSHTEPSKKVLHDLKRLPGTDLKWIILYRIKLLAVVT